MIYLEYLIKATNGLLVRSGKQGHFDAFSHDTRQLMPGELFVAVRGEHGDGHDYLLDAVRRGAGGLLLEGRVMAGLAEETRMALEEAGVAMITVVDTRVALQQYAHYILQVWHPTVIAVAGSVGKTSTKEAIASILASNFATFRSWKNYNDLLGIPLSLGGLEARHEYAVLELSCDHPGEISELCRITGPQMGVLTNISPAQLQYFGSVERLASELGTLLTALPPDGMAFVNGDDALIEPLTRDCLALVTRYFPSQAEDVSVSWAGTSCKVAIAPIIPTVPARETQTVSLASHLLGKHHVSTMLAAAMVASHCDLSFEEIRQALASVSPMMGRLYPLPGRDATRLLDDTHNATPASMVAGLEALKSLPGGGRTAVLGDMLRLGEYEQEAHRMVGTLAASCVDYLVLRGEYASLMAEAATRAGLSTARIILTSTHADAAEAVRQAVERAKRAGEQTETMNGKLPDVILIKGSEEARMERVTELLMAQPEEAPELLVRQTPGWKQIVVTRAERPTWVEIDLSAIANNTRQVKSLVGSAVSIMASLKADAYGHGALKVARTVLLNGASMLGVATVSEAAPLREAGINAPILVFGYVPPWQMREAVRLGLTITLYARESAQALSRAALALKRTVNVHVKVDTGMGRLGIRAERIEEIVALMQEVQALPRLGLEGIFTHFAIADSVDLTHARMQLSRFLDVLEAVERRGLLPPLVHAANSAALLKLPEARFTMVRPGVALYGLDPSEEVRLPGGFRPALSFKTQVAQVKDIPAGESIGYGGTYVAEEATRIAVLPVGYADGFRRGPTNWGTVLIHGQEAPIVGRVCMDQCMIDVSEIAQVRAGDEVVLIGQQGQTSLSAERVAQRLGTSNYEVVSAILARVPRVD